MKISLGYVNCKGQQMTNLNVHDIVRVEIEYQENETYNIVKINAFDSKGIRAEIDLFNGVRGTNPNPTIEIELININEEATDESQKTD